MASIMTVGARLSFPSISSVMRRGARAAAFAGLVAAACVWTDRIVAAEASAVMQKETPVSWSVELVSEGGITGRGLGNVAARSDGTVQLLQRDETRTPAAGQATYRAACSMPLAPDQAVALARAVTGAAPSAWQPRYANMKNPYAAADEILSTLTIERTTTKGVERHVVQWVSEREGTLPEDLATLQKALRAVMPRGGCTM